MSQTENFLIRRFLPRDTHPRLDELGFLRDDMIDHSHSADELLLRPAVLILAPPWMGKTYAANQFNSHLCQHSSRSSRRKPFGSYVQLTPLKRLTAGQQVCPQWWKKWRRASRMRACWLVDGVDEDYRRQNGLCHQILDLVTQLPAATRRRLCLLMFCRTNEVPREFQEHLYEVYGEPSGDTESQLWELRLAPVDRSSARQLSFFESDAEFAQTCEVIRRHRLRSCAGFPAVLKALKSLGEANTLDAAKVWQTVIENLIRDRNTDDIVGQNIEDQFHAAKQIAAAITFGSKPGIDDGTGDSDCPTVDQLITSESPRAKRLRPAARRVMRSGLFVQRANTFQFAEQHVQDWMAAFALRDASLTRIRPLIADRDGTPFGKYHGLIGILSNITNADDVRRWISDSFNGLPPRSDAAPLSLADTESYLDRLQELARAAGGSFSRWVDGPNLADLETPGLGDVLATRITDCSLTDAEREFLIDVAIEVEAIEAAEAAVKIAVNDSELLSLRLSAAILLRRVGAAEDLKSIEEFVRKNSSDPDLQDLISTLVTSLLEKELWDFETALGHAPESHGDIGSFSWSLWRRLEDNMTLNDARKLLAFTDIAEFCRNGAGEQRKRRPSRSRRLHIIAKAVELVSAQSRLNAGDIDCLIPIAMSEANIDWEVSDQPNLVTTFANDERARRKLFRFGLRQSAEDNQPLNWRWRWVLQPGDLDWIVTLAQKSRVKSTVLWEESLRLAHEKVVTRKQRDLVRRLVKQSQPPLLKEWDANRQRYRREERERQREDREWERQHTVTPTRLQDAVCQVLSRSNQTLSEKMRLLSGICFVEDNFRAGNLTGDWNSLSKAVQSDVVDICVRGLTYGKPFKTPRRASFTSGMIWEAECFVRFLRNPPAGFSITKRHILKWLPTVLTTLNDEIGEIADRCAAIDATATECAIINDVQRRLQLDRPLAFYIDDLSNQIWDDQFARQVSSLLVASANVDGSIDILRILARRAPAFAETVAMQWIQRPERTAVHQKRKMTAIDVMLVLNPKRIWSVFRRRVRIGKRQFLLGLDCLCQHREESRPSLADWPPSLLEELCDMLFEHVPPVEDPRFDKGPIRIGREDELRRIREQTHATLYNRGAPEDKASLNHLSSRHPSIKKLYDRVIANKEAAVLLPRDRGIEKSSLSHTGVVEISEVVKVLDDAIYRVIRSPDDLQRILLEQFDVITETVHGHLSMLYGPRKGKEQRHLHEDALQAYLYCRLTDLLINRVLRRETTVAFINREPLASKDQRLDIKVEAPTVTGEHATVVIEVKWSDNPDVSTSLIDQLGKQYLIDDNRTHGIYLVGFTSAKTRWKRTAIGRRPKPIESIAAWEPPLLEQAGTLRQEHPNIRIIPRLIDLNWPPPAHS